MVICLERGADLHLAQLMPLPLTVSCFSKIWIGFTFLVPDHPGSPGKRAIKRVSVCVNTIMLKHMKKFKRSEVQISALAAVFIRTGTVVDILHVQFGTTGVRVHIGCFRVHRLIKHFTFHGTVNERKLLGLITTRIGNVNVAGSSLSTDSQLKQSRALIYSQFRWFTYTFCQNIRAWMSGSPSINDSQKSPVKYCNYSCLSNYNNCAKITSHKTPT